MSDQISHTPLPPDLPPPASTRDTALPEKKPKHRAWVWIIVLLVFGLVFWWVLHRDQGPASGPVGRGGGTVTLTTATASKGDIGIYLTAIGTVTPVYTLIAGLRQVVWPNAT